jgi:hypothetical protein
MNFWMAVNIGPRRILLRLALLSAPSFLLSSAANSSAQELEFRGARFIGRVDYPYLIQNWRFSDLNGNRRLDASESLDTWSSTPHDDEPPQDLTPIDQVDAPMGKGVAAGRLLPVDDPQQLMLGHLDEWGTSETGGPFTPDEVRDDINGDGDHGPTFDLEDPAWAPETRIIGVGADFDDHVLLPPAYMDWAVQLQAGFSNVQFVHVLTFATPNVKDQPPPETTDVIDFSYGANFYGIPTAFDVHAYGGVLGRASWLSSLDNRTMGLQMGVSWTRRWRMLQLQSNASASVNYNLIAAKHTLAIGEDLVPGQYNRPLYVGLSEWTHEVSDDAFSPLAELGVRGSCFLSRDLQLYVGFDWLGLYGFRNAPNVTIEESFGYLTSVGVHWQR